MTFRLGVGVRAATLHMQNNKVTQVVMDHQKPEFYGIATAEQAGELARSLGLTPEAVLDTGLPVQVVSTGVRQLFMPVRSLKEIQVLKVSNHDAAALARLCRAIDPVQACNDLIMVYCTETALHGSNVHARAFAPALGIAEDAATGSASGGLGAYLVKHKVIAATPNTTRIVSEQGLEMGRTSRIEIEVDGGPDEIDMVRVGGQAVVLMEGSLSW